ncbi:MAG: 3-hydroxyacyl-CoA dehydrogenase family protein [Chitinophagaceae bacterium]|nr:3-hydroxyacyl-CoA dehydrogenase family protein [Chitinophagaceae bacterium]
MKTIEPTEISVGVVGLGLMGSSIIVSLLKAGHEVIAVAPVAEEAIVAPQRILEQISICRDLNLLDDPITTYLEKLTVTEDYSRLAGCGIVLECVVEKIEIKEQVYRKIAEVVGNDTVVATNTSAIAISTLQKHISHPERFLGIHWAEPAYATRFLEITCGQKTYSSYADWIYNLAERWDKEPTLLKKDIHGFITNRLMYAVCREALNIVETGQASLDDVDKSFRYDVGSWISLMGIFRRMDFLGLKDYFEIFSNTFPVLCNSDKVPEVMQKLVDTDARGIYNYRGLYNYTAEEAARWEETFKMFNGEIYFLATLFPSRLPKEVQTVKWPK